MVPRIAMVLVLVVGLMAGGCSWRDAMLRPQVESPPIAPVPDERPLTAPAHEATAGPEVGPSVAPPPPAPPAPAPRLMPRDVVVGHSVDGVPLVLHVFGEGTGGTLIIGGIHGNEPTSAELAEYLIMDLMTQADPWSGPPLAILPRANPDGLARGTRTNARGVDVNRNFAAANWRFRKTGGAQWGGNHPESEPETRAILGAMYLTVPARIVSIHSIGGGRQCNNFDGPAQVLAQAMCAANGYPVVATLGVCHGSLGNWAGVDRSVPIITLELPRDQPGPDAWQQNREALFVAIRAEVPAVASAWHTGEETDAPAEGPASPLGLRDATGGQR